MTPAIIDRLQPQPPLTNLLTHSLVRGCDEGRGRSNEEGKEEEGTHGDGVNGCVTRK
jgi:hypothetical protein